MRMERSSARPKAAYFATNFVTLVAKPWFARVTTEVVARTSDQIPRLCTPIVRIRKRYKKNRVAALPITCKRGVAAFRRICLCFTLIGLAVLLLYGVRLFSDSLPNCGVFYGVA